MQQSGDQSAGDPCSDQSTHRHNHNINNFMMNDHATSMALLMHHQKQKAHQQHQLQLHQQHQNQMFNNKQHHNHMFNQTQDNYEPAQQMHLQQQLQHHKQPGIIIQQQQKLGSGGAAATAGEDVTPYGAVPSSMTGGGVRSATATGSGSAAAPSRYESQKRRDWNTFGQYLRNSRPPLPLSKCTGEHVLQFLRYLDQFGKTKVHAPRCPYFGVAQPAGTCECPLKQAWGSLDALIGRLRAAFEENGGKPESNPFGAKSVRVYLREVRDLQAKARGIAYEKKKRKKPACSASAHGGGGSSATSCSSSSNTYNTSPSCITTSSNSPISNSTCNPAPSPRNTAVITAGNPAVTSSSLHNPNTIPSSTSCRSINFISGNNNNNHGHHHHLDPPTPAPPTPPSTGGAGAGTTSGNSASFLIPGCY